MKTVIFACVHNAGRSQMAAAWFNRLADASKAVAVSAGPGCFATWPPSSLAASRRTRRGSALSWT